MARKQDWSPRGVSYARCDVTLEYDQLPHDHPQAIAEFNDLKASTDPEYHIATYEMSPREADDEAHRYQKLVDAYERKEWWYVRIFAHTIVMQPDRVKDYPLRVATVGDYLESNWPPVALRHIERSELLALYEQLLDLGFQCRSFHVLRLGSFTLQHPKAPGEKTWSVEMPPRRDR